MEGVGIGIPGPINSRGEAACAVNLYWGFTPVAQILGDFTGLKAQAGNDANVAALGEAWKGAAAGAQNIIMITLGTGVGGGIIINGKILAGSHGAGGEIGHALVVRGEEEKCNCGNHGCLEQYASATGIVRVAGRVLAASEDDSTLRELQNITAKDVLDAFKAGDAVAVRIMEYVGDLLGGAIAGFTTVVDPEAIVIGGGVSKAGQPLIDCHRKILSEICIFILQGDTDRSCNTWKRCRNLWSSQNGSLKTGYTYFELNLKGRDLFTRISSLFSKKIILLEENVKFLIGALFTILYLL